MWNNFQNLKKICIKFKYYKYRVPVPIKQKTTSKMMFLKRQCQNVLLFCGCGSIPYSVVFVSKSVLGADSLPKVGESGGIGQPPVPSPTLNT